MDYSWMTKSEKEMYFRGYKEALYDFAVYQNGTLIVGCGIFTYKQALEIKHEEIFGRIDDDQG